MAEAYRYYSIAFVPRAEGYEEFRALSGAEESSIDEYYAHMDALAAEEAEAGITLLRPPLDLNHFKKWARNAGYKEADSAAFDAYSDHMQDLLADE